MSDPAFPPEWVAALQWVDRCSEELTRQGELEPCDRTAVAFRLDPETGSPYPVCARHCRRDMVSLADVVSLVRADEATRYAIDVPMMTAALRTLWQLQGWPQEDIDEMASALVTDLGCRIAREGNTG